MAIGRTEDRNPLGPKPRRDVWGPIRVTHLGPRSTRPHTEAGHMTAIDQTRPSCKKPCEAGAVHTRVSDARTYRADDAVAAQADLSAISGASRPSRCSAEHGRLPTDSTHPWIIYRTQETMDCGEVQ